MIIVFKGRFESVTVDWPMALVLRRDLRSLSSVRSFRIIDLPPFFLLKEDTTGGVEWIMSRFVPLLPFVHQTLIKKKNIQKIPLLF